MPSPKNRNPYDQVETMRELKRDVMLSINCHQIGEIVSFDPGSQCATVKIAMKQIVSEDPNGVKTFQEYPLLATCPVIFLYGGTSHLTFPVSPGDSCLVLFNDRDIDSWFTGGTGGYPVTPRVHDLSDGVVIVGMRHMGNALSDFLTNGVRLAYSPDSRIDLKDDLIDSIAAMFIHTGNMTVTGNLTIQGDTYGNGTDDWNLKANLKQDAPYSIKAGNGATGTFSTVTVEHGIVTGGS